MARTAALPTQMPEGPHDGPDPRLIDAPLHTVEVHRVGATVYRRATLDVTDGAPDAIEITGLPLSLEDHTARLRVISSEAVVAGACRVTLFIKPPERVVDPPEAQAVKVAQRALLRTAQALSRVQAEIHALKGIRMPARPEKQRHGGPTRPDASPMQARLALSTFVDGQVRARMAEQAELEAKRLEQQRALADLQALAAEATTARKAKASQVSKSVQVALRAIGTVSGPLEVELSYRVPGAKWAPQYQVRLNAEGTATQIALRAVIAQQSGEDWSGVRLKLSTAMPRAQTALPKLKSMRIGRAQPTPPAEVGFRAAPRGADRLLEDHARARRSLYGRRPTINAAERLAPSQPAQPITLEIAAELHEQYDLALRPELHQLTQGLTSHERLLEGARRTRLYREALDAEQAASLAVGGPPAAGGAAADGYGGAMYDEMLAEEEDFAEPAMEAPEPMPVMARAAPPPSPAPAKPRRARSADKKMSKRGGGGLLSELPPQTMNMSALRRPQPSELPFDQLRLGSPDGPQRTKLQPMQQAEQYAAGLHRSGLTIDFDVEALTAEAWRTASQVQSRSLPAGLVPLDESVNLFDYAYEADHPVDVPSDGNFHSVPLGVREGECAVRYVVVPREDRQVYRLAQITNPTRTPMLTGPAEVYLGGEYILTTRLPTVAPKARFELGLGVEQAISCARNTHFKSQRSGERVVAMTELVHDISVELVNHMRRPAEIEIRERIPQPAPEAEVVVDEVEVSPPWEAYTQKERKKPIEGGRRWQITLAPGATQPLSARYIVKIYANNELVGGDRREA